MLATSEFLQNGASRIYLQSNYYLQLRDMQERRGSGADHIADLAPDTFKVSIDVLISPNLWASTPMHVGRPIPLPFRVIRPNGFKKLSEAWVIQGSRMVAVPRPLYQSRVLRPPN